MNEYHQHIAELIVRDLQGSSSEHERTELFEALKAEPAFRQFYEAMRQGDDLHDGLHALSTVDTIAAVNRLRTKITASNNRTIHRVHLLKRAWLRYAAAVLFIVGIGAYLWNAQTKEKPSVATTTNPVPVQNDVAPGGNKAILTLSDGRKVELTAKKQSIADAGMTIENANGKLLYEKGGEVAYNTMTTPKGGQYQVTLPDGTNVWMNAASSITYPTAFKGKTRHVKISGEVYFEVAKNAQQPFIVDVDGKANVEVLGTSFNVHAYGDEPAISTTLLEGKVRVKKEMETSALMPGQQAIINKGIIVRDHVNVRRAVAWKNGFFDFQDKKLTEVMRELSRWYDIEVHYAAGVKDIEFVGNVNRSLQLSEVVKVLQEAGVHFTIQENRKLLVQP